jgi:hypothetical protein
MAKRLVLAVEIAHKMLGTLWQVEDSGQVDNFPDKRTLCGIFFG